MKLECIVQPEQEPLTLTDVKAYLRIDGDTEDALLASLISAAREYCESYQHRAYGEQTLRLTLPAIDAQASIELPRSKDLVEIKNISVNNNFGTKEIVDDYTISYSSINANLSLMVAVLADDDLCIDYIVKGDCDQSTMMAMRLLVASWYENRLAVDSKSYNEVPFAVTALLNPGRVLL